MREALEALEPRGTALPAPPGRAGERAVRIPVGEVGDWVIWTSGPDRLPRVSVVRDGRLAVPDLAALRCSEDGRPSSPPGHSGLGERTDATIPASATATFTDADLRSSIEAHPAGVVVYVWSPHMPLSVDGYREVVAGADALGLTVEPVLFSEGERSFARREAERVGMPAAALRELDAAELVFRDAQVHAPSVVVFAGDRVSPVLPGYRDADGYRRWMERVLDP